MLSPGGITKAHDEDVFVAAHVGRGSWDAMVDALTSFCGGSEKGCDEALTEQTEARIAPRARRFARRKSIESISLKRGSFFSEEREMREKKKVLLSFFLSVFSPFFLSFYKLFVIKAE